ncbi:MAG: FliM/FliN family flagellar motor switch protein [Rhodobacter sp.]|nr:FliM/FliN family flagellar motor switch protein [Rhodobacter sp.]
MRDEAAPSVLRRMAGSRAEAAGPGEMTAAKALRNAFARAGDEVLATIVDVHDVAETSILPDALGNDLPESALFLRLEGPGLAVGLVVACPQVVAAVIEAQTMGAVLNTAAVNRKPTRTDAVLVGGFLGKVLGAFGVMAQGCVPRPPVDGYRCGAGLADARAAQMFLADVAHRSFRIGLDFANGAKTGTLSLNFPVDRGSGALPGQSAENWHATLENAVMGTAARIEAVLCRIKLPLADVAALTVGDCLPLSGATLDGVLLVGSNGSPVMRARLGRSGSVRAVRLDLGSPAARPRPAMVDGPSMVSRGVAMRDPGVKPDVVVPDTDETEAGSGDANPSETLPNDPDPPAMAAPPGVE